MMGFSKIPTSALTKLGAAATIFIGATIGTRLHMQNKKSLTYKSNDIIQEKNNKIKSSKSHSEMTKDIERDQQIEVLYRKILELSNNDNLDTSTSVYLQDAIKTSEEYLKLHNIIDNSYELEGVENEWIDSTDFWATPPPRKNPYAPCRNKTLKILLMALANLTASQSNLQKDVLTEDLFLALNAVLNESDEGLNQLVTQVIGNLVTNTDYLHYIDKAELGKKLSELSKSESPGVFLGAWRALHNIELVKNKVSPELQTMFYSDGIFPMFPLDFRSQTPEVDIVLVHGIMGGASWTWRQHDSMGELTQLSHKDREDIFPKCSTEQHLETLNSSYTWCWPLDWLYLDLGIRGRVIAVDYPAHWWMWDSGASLHTKSIKERSDEMLKKLELAGVGTRPIIWICHSLGGLLVKHMLATHKESNELKDCSNVCNKTSGVVFLSVPHFGTPVASASCQLGALTRPSQEVQDMRADLPELKTLHDTFLNICNENSTQILTLNENKPSNFGGLIDVILVPLKYGDPGIGELHEIDVIHRDICKPENRDSPMYQHIKKFVNKVLDSIRSS